MTLPTVVQEPHSLAFATDFLNNNNALDYGDSIVSIGFGNILGDDGWSTGFTGECGNMGTGALQNSGTFWIWIR